MSRLSNVSCSAGLRSGQNRVLNRKPSKEVKQYENRTNCNHGPRGSQGIEHVRDRRIAGGSGRNGGAGSRGKQWGDVGRNQNRLGDLRRRVRIQGGSHRELPEGSESGGGTGSTRGGSLPGSVQGSRE